MSSEQIAALKEQLTLAQAHIAELEQIQKAASEKAELRAKFSHAASLEWRSVLQTITQHATSLLSEVQGLLPETSLAKLQDIVNRSSTLAESVEEIVNPSAFTFKRDSLDLESFYVAGLIQQVANIIQPLAEEEKTAFELSPSEHLGTMYADQVKIRSILTNLLAKAVNRARAGTIRLSVARQKDDDNDWLTFQISDTGDDLPSEQLEKLLQLFARYDLVSPRRHDDVDIGILLVTHYCKLMGGDITVKSEPTVGTTFTVRVPTVASQPATG